MSNGQLEKESAPLEALAAFATLRGRPAVFLILPQESLDLKHLVQLQSALGDQQFEEVDFVVHSGGGNINVAYQIVELIRLHTKRLFVCVPFYAKSAATLLCLGADEIVLDKLAQLGPLDAQVYEKKKGGGGDFTSALNPFKTLEQLQVFSLETLAPSVNLIEGRYPLDLDESIRYAIDFVVGTTGHLFSRLDLEKLGEYSRALAVGSAYGARLLRRFSNWNYEKRTSVVDKLVHGYPSHDYVIDYHELEELGFSVRLFEGEERDAMQAALLAALHIVEENESSNSLIDLVVPSEPTKKTARAKEPKEAAS